MKLPIVSKYSSRKILAVGVVLLCLLLIGGGAAVLHVRHSQKVDKSSDPDKEYVDDLTQEKNFAGTGDSEHVSATSSNQYICTGYKGSLPSSDMTVNASAAIADITGSIADLYQNGSFSSADSTDSQSYVAATSAADDAASHLQTAADAAAKNVQLCSLIGVLKSGSAQMASLHMQLADGQATNADLKAAVQYAETLRQVGFN